MGAGSAGLSVSHFLRQAGVGHVLLERGEIGESWRSQRWDSFRVNTPNHLNVLVGAPYSGPEPDAFPSQSDLVEGWDAYAARQDLPVRTHTAVRHVGPSSEAGFDVNVEGSDGLRHVIRTGHVVVAAGGFTVPKVPAFAAKLPAPVLQLTAASYKNPGQLSSGPVLVVGSGDSGCQITEDLLASGRKVYLCTSKRRRVPRRYRGDDSTRWGVLSGRYDWGLDKLPDKRAIWNPDAPLYSGVGPMGHTLAYQQLERDGATLVGKLVDYRNGKLLFDDSVNVNVAFGDESSAGFKAGTDALLEQQGIDAPPDEYDPFDQPDTLAGVREVVRSLDLVSEGIASVIWAIGFTHDFTWLDVPVFDADGHPVQERGVAAVDGIYFVGLHWLHTLGSGLLVGVGKDAEYVASVIFGRLGTGSRD
ncbi:MAG: NAD(P)/FAD-dependent oxidoreductase [Dehalococcoidia bacterium]